MRLFLIAALCSIVGISTASAQDTGHDLGYYVDKDYKIVGFTHAEPGNYDVYVLQNGHSVIRCNSYNGWHCQVVN